MTTTKGVVRFGQKIKHLNYLLWVMVTDLQELLLMHINPHLETLQCVGFKGKKRPR